MEKSLLDLEVVEMKTTIDSREVAEMMGKAHGDLLKDIKGSGKNLGIIPTLEKGNFPVSDYFIESSYQAGTNNKSYTCFECTKMGCEMLGNKLQGEKGILFTASYVKRFNVMEERIVSLAVPVLDSYAIDDRIARAQRWIEEETERQNLRIVAAEQQKDIEVLAPKAAFADAMNASEDCILIRELAKILKQNGAPVGERKLFDKLRQYGYLIKNEFASDFNQPTQMSMNLKLFELKRTTIVSSSGSSRVNITSKVTPKGVEYFVKKFLNGKMVF